MTNKYKSKAVAATIQQTTSDITLRLVQGLCLAVALVLSQAVFAGVIPTFAEADRDGDGVLSADEAAHAFPSIEIVDVNRDGIINKFEVKLALPEVAFKEHDMGSVGAQEYRMIMQALERQNARLREAVTIPETVPSEG